MYLYRKKYTIDFTNVQYYSEMHGIIGKSLDFPDYYGCNWAAFWDCLTDMYGDAIHIEIIGIDVIRRKFGDAADKMLEILKEFKHYEDDEYANDIQIELVSGSVRVTLE